MHTEQVDDRAARRTYLVLLVGVLLVVVALWAVVGATDAFRHVVFPVIVLVYGALAIGVVTRRVPLMAVGAWLVGSTAALLLGRLVTWEAGLVARPADLVGSVTTVLGGFGIVFALAFLVFGTRRGAIVSLAGFSLLYLAVGLSAVWGMLATADSIDKLAFAPVVHATLIAVVWILARNVERLAAAQARAALLELQASTDPLTGAANRRRLDDDLDRLIAQAHRSDQPLSVVLVDLDDFKAVNDTHGHDTGDRVLVETVDRLTAAVRAADLVGRWGGEEFLLLAPHTNHPAARALAERCRSALGRSPMRAAGVTVTASFGVSTLGPGDDARALMRRADLALYAAKSEGCDRVVGLPDITGRSVYPVRSAVACPERTRPVS